MAIVNVRRPVIYSCVAFISMSFHVSAVCLTRGLTAPLTVVPGSAIMIFRVRKKEELSFAFLFVPRRNAVMVDPRTTEKETTGGLRE